MKITADSIVVAAPEQLSADLGDEAVIAGVARGNYYGLNAVGARVWQLLQTPRHARDLRQTLAEEYAVTADRCEADLIELLERMHDEGLIEVTNAA